ncbi:unnamed protein product [Thelazia callipaeda]|uniref:Uncharacterized protein n=1 Tax=Thelazia callipaeda TaxID=103827 RepID=A0A0N5D3P3_THECL|nr:unnamed protein product [Thelazia callipaeda]
MNGTSFTSCLLMLFSLLPCVIMLCRPKLKERQTCALSRAPIIAEKRTMANYETFSGNKNEVPQKNLSKKGNITKKGIVTLNNPAKKLRNEKEIGCSLLNGSRIDGSEQRGENFAIIGSLNSMSISEFPPSHTLGIEPINVPSYTSSDYSMMEEMSSFLDAQGQMQRALHLPDSTDSLATAFEESALTAKS